MRRGTLTVLLGALLSRLLGFARDASFAWLLGGSGAADALAAALRLPYMARRLFGEGTLSLALTVACAGEGAAKGRGALLARAVSRRLAPGAGLFVLALAAAAPWLMAAVAPGLLARPEALRQAAALFRLSAPYILFAVLAAGGMAALHSRERFLLPALAPTAFNLVVLAFAAAGALALRGGATSGRVALWLAGGVLAGGVCQWLLHVPAAAALRREERRALAGPPDRALVRRVLGRVPAGIFGAAMPQLAFLLASMLASFQPGGHLAALFYAERLLEFPLGVLGAAVGMTAAPRLARLAAGAGPALRPGRPEAGPPSRQAVLLQEETRRAVALSLGLNLPAAAGLMAVAAPLVAVLFMRGSFDAGTASMTSLALCAYAPGLPAYALSRPLLAACHALEDTAAPVAAAAAGLALTLAGGGLLLFAGGPGLAAAGPPLGVSVGLWTYVLLLWRRVGRRLACGLRPAAKTLFWQALGSLAVFAAASGIVDLSEERHLPDLAALALAVAAGIAVYGLALLWGDRPFFRMLAARARDRDPEG